MLSNKEQRARAAHLRAHGLTGLEARRLIASLCCLSELRGSILSAMDATANAAPAEALDMVLDACREILFGWTEQPGRADDGDRA